VLFHKEKDIISFSLSIQILKYKEFRLVKYFSIKVVVVSLHVLSYIYIYIYIC